MNGGGDAADRELSAVAAAAGRHLLDLSHDIWLLLTSDIPELRGDDIVEKLLDASVQENVPTLLHVFEHGLVPDNLPAPAAAVEYARRLAQRGVPIVALVRAYRVGHGRFLSWCVDELAGRSPDADLAAAVTSRMIDRSFRYIDRVSVQVTEAYQQERDRWLLTQTAVRAARVRTMLGDEPVDVEATESALGYRLQQHHLGVVAWVTDAVHGSDGLTRLDRLASAAARALGGPASSAARAARAPSGSARWK